MTEKLDLEDRVHALEEAMAVLIAKHAQLCDLVAYARDQEAEGVRCLLAGNPAAEMMARSYAARVRLYQMAAVQARCMGAFEIDTTGRTPPAPMNG